MNGQFDFGELQPSKYFAAVAVVIGLLFSFIAPDGENIEGGFKSILHWQCQTLLPMLFAVLIHLGLSRIGALLRVSAWSKLFISGVLASILFSPLAVVLDYFFTKEPIEHSILVDSLDELFALAPPIVICWLAINAPFQLGWRVSKNASMPHQGMKSETIDQTEQPLRPEQVVRTEESVKPEFMKLLPDEVVGEIIYLKSELHYLMVVTDAGKALILYSLKNAINQLADMPGVQPHRSYWVNRDFTEGLEKKGREGIISLKGGYSVPVSRSRITAVRDALNL